MTLVKKISLLCLSLLSSLLYAQSPQIKVSAPSQVAVGNHFQLTYQIDADVESFKVGDFGNMQLLSGPNKSQRSNIQMINGKVSQNISLSYTYVLMPTTTGTWQSPKASVQYKGKTYQSGSKTIKVVKAAANSTQSSGNTAQNTGGNTGLKASDLYIKAFANKRHVYLGEQLVVTYKIYTRVGVSDLGFEKTASFSGFWTVDMDDNTQNGLQQQEETINGERYIVATLKKTALFPQKIGKLSIPPIKLNCTVQVRSQGQRQPSNDPFDSFFNDPFFSSRYRNVEKVLSSNPLTIQVKDFPEANKPAHFNGAVGDFSFSSHIDHKTLKANEVLTVKYTVSGSGNIDLLPDLKPNFPPDFEVYDPKINAKARKKGNKISGYKTYEYTIIPRSAGQYEIPSVGFSYFNPHTKKYISLQSDAYQIEVEKGKNNNNNEIYGGKIQEEVRYLGKDIRHIALMPFALSARHQFFYGSWGYIAGFVLPIILLTLIVWWQRQQKRKRGNVVYMKNRNATKIARKRLKKAQQFLKAHAETEFYNEIAQALWGYVSDKFAIPLAELSMDSVHDKLANKAVDEGMIQAFIEVLNNCEYARFAPGNKDTTMDNIYKQGLDIISKIESQLK